MDYNKKSKTELMLVMSQIDDLDKALNRLTEKKNEFASFVNSYSPATSGSIDQLEKHLLEFEKVIHSLTKFHFLEKRANIFLDPLNKMKEKLIKKITHEGSIDPQKINADEIRGPLLGYLSKIDEGLVKLIEFHKERLLEELKRLKYLEGNP